MEYIWPILVAVIASTLYNILAKSTPEGVQPFASLTITYITAAAVACILFFITSENKNLLIELHKTNWTSYAFGCSIVILEFGFISMYRAGFNISIGSLIVNICVAIALLIIGVLFYKENISLKQIIGVVFCIVGIILISKK